jgi:hypothetical protein
MAATANTDKLDLYFRDIKGRIITHFLIDAKIIEELEEYARQENKTLGQLISEEIRRIVDED